MSYLKLFEGRLLRGFWCCLHSKVGFGICCVFHFGWRWGFKWISSGQIGYALVPMIVRGMMLGPDQPVILHMLDIPQATESLNGVKMELIDVAFPLLKGVVATTDVVEACTSVNITVMVAGFPRKEGMERKDVMSKNVSIYKAQASTLEKHADKKCKINVCYGFYCDPFTPNKPYKPKMWIEAWSGWIAPSVLLTLKTWHLGAGIRHALNVAQALKYAPSAGVLSKQE